jgi:hypothetical protein
MGPKTKLNLLLIFGAQSRQNDYAISIASTGHSSTHTPQSTQVSASTTALPSTIFIASAGQASTHASQPVHLSSFTFAGIKIPFQKHRNHKAFLFTNLEARIIQK